MTYKKFVDIERLGHEDNKDILFFGDDLIVVEEKVDGGCGALWDGGYGGHHVGSRNRDLTSDGDKKTFAKQRIWLFNHLDKLQKEGVALNPDFIYYFEWMQLHTIRYTRAPDIIGFDIRLKHSMEDENECGLFLDRKAKEKEFQRIGIECVPLVWEGKANELKKLNVIDLIPKSKYYDGIAEGICIKNYGRKRPGHNYQLFAKVVREEFKEQNKAVFGSVKNKDSDTQKIVEQYCTEARIRKAVLKFTNEDGLKLELALMKYVPTYVIKDILKEEFKDIYNQYNFIDFKDMKKIVPKLCIKVISDMMQERVVKNEM